MKPYLPNPLGVLTVALALLAGASVPMHAKAAAPYQEQQSPGFYRMKLGDFEVTTLYDGDVNLDMQLMHAESKQLAVLLEDKFYDPKVYKGYVCGFLVNTGTHLILVDAGAGGHWGPPTLGRLLANLKASGYKPEQVDLVLLTHLHPDHVPGIMLADGSRAFPKAQIRMAKAESDFWLSKEIQLKAPASAQEFFKTAQDASVPYISSGKWQPFEGAAELVPGVRPVPIAGHTPGHTGYEFKSKGQVMLIWGDVVHAEPVQFPHPEITIAFDGDPVAAEKSRQAMFESLARTGTLVAGPHMPFPAIGRLRKATQGFVWVPVPYVGNP